MSEITRYNLHVDAKNTSCLLSTHYAVYKCNLQMVKLKTEAKNEQNFCESGECKAIDLSLRSLGSGNIYKSTCSFSACKSILVLKIPTNVFSEKSTVTFESNSYAINGPDNVNAQRLFIGIHAVIFRG